MVMVFYWPKAEIQSLLNLLSMKLSSPTVVCATQPKLRRRMDIEDNSKIKFLISQKKYCDPSVDLY